MLQPRSILRLWFETFKLDADLTTESLQEDTHTHTSWTDKHAFPHYLTL